MFTANLRQKCTEYKRTDFCKPLNRQTWAAAHQVTLIQERHTAVSNTCIQMPSSFLLKVQMNSNCGKYCKFFYKAVELSHKHINRQTFCWLPRKLSQIWHKNHGRGG